METRNTENNLEEKAKREGNDSFIRDVKTSRSQIYRKNS